MSKLDWMYENYMKATEKDVDEPRAELQEKHPDVFGYIEEQQKDGYGVPLKKLRDRFPDEDAQSLKEKGFTYTGKNKREDGIPSGRITIPEI